VTIFVSIASYRDCELVPTVLDCIAHAANPDDLRIVVCWQHAPDEDVAQLRDDPRVELIDVDYRDSQGACWARAEIMRRYAGEDFYCQVDSHTRWAPDWDVRAQKMLAATGSPKPLLSTYPPEYRPGQEVDPHAHPSKMVLDTFDDVLPVFRAHQMSDPAELIRPVRARFIGASFIFVGGEFVRDVPYDPDLYFIGEEITLALRAFTCGYDMFHPNEVLVYHHYLRDHRPKHWSDHDDQAPTPWWRRDRRSRRRAANVLHCAWARPFGCGTARTAADYQSYAGVDFLAMTGSDEARSGIEPRSWTG
jgi:Glycosyltransferase (GlcNAc)